MKSTIQRIDSGAGPQLALIEQLNEGRLAQAVSIIEAPVGKGHVVLFGNEVLWRAQPHGTFKLLFNGIFLSAAQ